MNTDFMIVECCKCKKVIKMPYTCIININDHGNPKLCDKFQCSHCGEIHMLYIKTSKKYLNDDFVEVKCSKCEKTFKMPKWNIEGKNGIHFTLIKKYLCPHCNEMHNLYIDPTIHRIYNPNACPHCKSFDYIMCRGFSVTNAILGNLTFGKRGSLFGVASGKLYCRCLKCGTKWKPNN